MTFFQIYLVGLGVILTLMIVLWLVSLRLKNSSIVDIFWGTGFVIAAWIYFALTPDGYLPRKLLLAALVSIWGLRLSFHILKRNWNKPEDFRYQKWRQESGKSWWWLSLFRVFLLQGILLWIISIPLLAAQNPAIPARLTALDFAGVILWLVGFYFESAGDAQLARFKADPTNRGKVMNRGVWRYTRHPNYFGDSAQWWGFLLIAASAGGWWTVFSPALMTYLLVKVSGVALLEKTMQARPGYQEYMQVTSAFIPWFPREYREPAPEELTSYESLKTDLIDALSKTIAAQETGEWPHDSFSKEYDRLDKLIPRNNLPYDRLGRALYFWDCWIDARNHNWRNHPHFQENEWLSIARQVIKDVEDDRDLSDSRLSLL